MLPIIGFIIGIYTAVRLLSMGTKDERGDNNFVRGMAIIAAVVTIFLMIALLNASDEFTKQNERAQAEMRRLTP